MLFTRATGVVRDEDIRRLARAITDDPEMRPDFDRLNDFTEVTAVEVSTEVIWEMAQVYGELDSSEGPRGMKIAAVTTKDVVYGLMLMYQTLRTDSPFEFKTFRDMSQARAWLGLPPKAGDSHGPWNEVCS
jgi:hypothetical protein